MNYKEFLIIAKEYFQTKLPDCTVSIKNVVKSNDLSRDALIIREANNVLGQVIYLESSFEKYRKGEKSIDDVLAEMVISYLWEEDSSPIDLSIITRLELARNHIVCKLGLADINKAYITDKPFRQVGDFIVTYHVVFGDDFEYSVAITNEILNLYGISEDELYKIAVDNIRPEKFVTLRSLLPDMGITYNGSGGYNSDMYYLSSAEKNYGASIILCQDIMDEIAERLGGNYYVLPASLEMVMVFPKGDADVGKLELQRMLREINARCLSPTEKLSDDVYEYLASEHRLVKCEDSF